MLRLQIISRNLHPFRRNIVCPVAPVCYHIRLAHDSCCSVTCNVGSHDSCKLHLINLSSKYSGMRDPPPLHSNTHHSPDAATLVSLCLQWPEFKVRLCRFETTWKLFISVEWFCLSLEFPDYPIIPCTDMVLLWHHTEVTLLPSVHVLSVVKAFMTGVTDLINVYVLF